MTFDEEPVDLKSTITAELWMKDFRRGGRNSYVRAIEQAIVEGREFAAVQLTIALVRLCRRYHELPDYAAQDR